jgi:hypothetical protein
MTFNADEQTLTFTLRDVDYGWKLSAVVNVPDGINYTAITDQYEPIKQYTSFKSVLQLYECATLEIPAEEHPLSSGFPIVEQNRIVKLELAPQRATCTHPIETSYGELRRAATPFLADVLRAIDAKSSAGEREQAFDYIHREYRLLGDFEEIYDSVLDD